MLFLNVKMLFHSHAFDRKEESHSVKVRDTQCMWLAMMPTHQGEV